MDAENRRKSVYAFFHPTFGEMLFAMTEIVFQTIALGLEGIIILVFHLLASATC